MQHFSFNKLADLWWKQDSSMQALHAINEARVQFLNKHISGNNLRLLDLACGGGILINSLKHANEYNYITGVDIAPSLIQLCKQKFANFLHIECIESDILRFKSSKKHDVVCLFEFIEHVSDPLKYLIAAKQHLTANGKLFLSCINSTFLAKFLAVDVAEFIGLTPKGCHDKELFLPPSKLVKLLHTAGFDVKNIQGVAYNPLNNKAYLSDDLSVNYFIQADLA